MKGASATEEVGAAAEALHRQGCAPPEIHSLGADLTDSPTAAIRVAWADPARVRLARPDRSATKRPGRGR
jgi:16S rRNA (guanine527-N7)-methyltransferase